MENDDQGNSEPKTAEQLASGEVAYLLNGSTSEGTLNWYQNIGVDDYPVLDNTHAVVLYDGEKYYNYSAHEHTLVHHAAVPPTCTENGTGEYWKCEGKDACNKMFSDENGIEEIAEIPTLTATGHSYGAWSIITEPTFTITGKAERICGNDNTHKDNVDLPILTDTSVWTVGARVEPTETADGSQAYTSDYGNITITIPALGHTHDWGEWNITTEPTFTESGIAERVCTENIGHKDTFILPILTDTTVWEVGLRVEPTEIFDGFIQYISQYGTVSRTIHALSDKHFLMEYFDGTAMVSARDAGTYSVIFAAYDISGVLKSVELKPVTFETAGVQEVIPQNFNTNGANTVKVMLWDSLKGMKPLCAADWN